MAGIAGNVRAQEGAMERTLCWDMMFEQYSTRDDVLEERRRLLSVWILYRVTRSPEGGFLLGESPGRTTWERSSGE